ncbi:unnamed protein product [Enterobius vermicularis]|uniref:DSBA domain-containing protein n=1 Tax=Enterobius vermicularis TaxID=51028 RepID=A0A158QAN0_ENTVE|nr:unnamed protein product [Enterobius vermicularis]
MEKYTTISNTAFKYETEQSNHQQPSLALIRYEKLWPIQLVLRPVLLSKILSSTGNKSPLTEGKKSKQMYTELNILSNYWNVPLCFSENFAERILQNDTEYAQSFLTVISDKNSSKLLEASRAIWLRFWKENKLTNKKDDLIEVAKSIAVDEEFVEIASETLAKKKLQDTTVEAVNSGAFGVPWIIVTDKDTKLRRHFFGSDRLPLIAQLYNLNFTGPSPVYGGKVEEDLYLLTANALLVHKMSTDTGIWHCLVRWSAIILGGFLTKTWEKKFCLGSYITEAKRQSKIGHSAKGFAELSFFMVELGSSQKDGLSTAEKLAGLMLHTNLSVVGVAVIRTNGVLASIRFTKALALHRNYTWHARSLLTTRPFQVQRYDIIGLLYTSIIRLESVT